MYRATHSFGPYNSLTGQTVNSYAVEVVLQSENLFDFRFMLNAQQLASFGEYVSGRLEERDVSKQFSFNPMPESLARHFFEYLRSTTSWNVAAVRVSDDAARVTGEYFT